MLTKLDIYVFILFIKKKQNSKSIEKITIEKKKPTDLLE
jgi:hypothetical protein